jgi:predicted phage-related endonuclease
MGATNTNICYVPAFLGGKGFRLYKVTRDDDLMSDIEDACLDFWSYVDRDEPPPHVMPTLAFAKRMKRTEGKSKSVPEQMVKNWQNAKESMKQAEGIVNAAHAAILAELGDAEVGIIVKTIQDATGKDVMVASDIGTLTLFEQGKKYIDRSALMKAHPKIAAEFDKESRFRVLRIKKHPKKKGVKKTKKGGKQ